MATYSSFKKINTEAIIDGSITGNALGTNSITTAAFDSASVRTADIANSSVGTTQLASSIDFSGKTITYRPFVNTDFANTSIAGGQLAPGAIASNLGYTPANKAGVILSGPLVLPSASASAPALASNGNTNTGIHFAAANQVQISTAAGNTNSFVKSGDNVMHTQPNLPAFHASGNGGWYYGSAFGGAGRWAELNNLQPGGGFAWQVVQKGGSNCSSNGRFTAPVAGWYTFYCQTYFYNDTNNSQGYVHWNIGLNGSPSTDRQTGRAPHSMFSHQVSANHVPGIACTLEVYMNASDYCIPQPYFGGGNTGRMHGDHSLWCGYLIG
jgi:hypothetical protein